MVHFQLIKSKFLTDFAINYESKYVKYENRLYFLHIWLGHTTIALTI